MYTVYTKLYSTVRLKLFFLPVTVALETLCVKKDEELASKNKQIEVLRRKMRTMKEGHKQEMESLHLKVQQEMYIAQTLNHNRLPVVTRNKSTKRKQ